MTAGRKIAVDRQLGGAHAQLLQPPDLGAGERLVGQVGEGRAAPQRERRARLAVGRVGGCRRSHEPLETRRVNPVGRQLEFIPAPARDDLRVAPVEQLPQMRHVELHELVRARRRPLIPQTLDQPIGRDRAIDLQREHRQHGALLWRAERYGPVIDARLDSAKEANFHAR